MNPAPRSRLLLLVLLTLASVLSLRAAGNAPESAAFVRDFYACYNPAGAAKLGDFYTDDATFVDPSFELDLKGRLEIGGLLTRALGRYEAMENEIRHVTPAGDNLIVEGTMVGKISGKTVRVPFVSIFHFVGGKIATQRDLFDTLHYFTQLGLVEHPWHPKPKAN